jgi:hypothetical protein
MQACKQTWARMRRASSGVMVIKIGLQPPAGGRQQLSIQ